MNKPLELLVLNNPLLSSGALSQQKKVLISSYSRRIWDNWGDGAGTERRSKGGLGSPCPVGSSAVSAAHFRLGFFLRMVYSGSVRVDEGEPNHFAGLKVSFVPRWF